MSDAVRPHRRQPTRLPRPWDSPGKNTGVGCHFLLQCMKVKSESEVAQSCPTLATPWAAAHQAPPSMGLSKQKYWSGVPLPSLVLGLVHCILSRVLWCKSSVCSRVSSLSENHGIRSHHFMANRWWNNGNSVRLYFLGLQNHCSWWLQPWNLKTLAPWKKSMTNPDNILKSRDITDKGPSSQSYGFSSSHVWMWELEHKESWVLNN